MQNSLLHRESQHLKSVCWFALSSSIENVPFSLSSPFYDIYLYHGTLKSCGLFESTKVHLGAYLTDPDT